VKNELSNSTIRKQNDTKRSLGHVEFDNENLERLKQQSKYKTEFSPNPVDLTIETFENEDEICVKEINIDLKTVVESYKKCISK
jgi:hypothetical protein